MRRKNVAPTSRNAIARIDQGLGSGAKVMLRSWRARHYDRDNPSGGRVFRSIFVNVLFICEDNCSLGLMAESILATLAQGRFTAYSAGSSAGRVSRCLLDAVAPDQDLCEPAARHAQPARARAACGHAAAELPLATAGRATPPRAPR